jgi:hypothetical protein
MPTDAVRLSPEERDVAAAEVEAVLALAQPGEYRERLARLAPALGEPELDAESAEELDTLLGLALQSGRVRALYGPGGEQAALRLYRRLPTGAGVAASAREVSEALGALRGRELDAASIQVVGPGAFSLTLRAGGVDVAVRLDRQGARLATVEV